MSRRSFLLPEELAGYLDKVGYREPDVLFELRQETAGLAMARMQIAPEQGQFLSLLVKLMGARRCLEVGVFTGYSSLAVAQALPSDGEVLACDVNEEWTAIARRYWKKAGVESKVRLVLAPAIETLDTEISKGSPPFDFAFIDADKTNYANYYERVLKLLRPGGLVVVDNTLWSGRVAEAGGDEDTCALREFNEFVASDERVDLCLLPVADGLTLLRKR